MFKSVKLPLYFGVWLGVVPVGWGFFSVYNSERNFTALTSFLGLAYLIYSSLAACSTPENVTQYVLLACYFPACAFGVRGLALACGGDYPYTNRHGSLQHSSLLRSEG